MGYDGNKLLKVDDWIAGSNNMPGFKDKSFWGNDYGYDENGNMTSDFNKDIASITYNHLNLPQLITITGKGSIEYTYDAAGNKLVKKVVDNTIAVTKTSYTYYAGAFIYKQTNTDPVELETINHEEGRLRPKKIDEQQPLTPANITYIYDYFMKDHLGNVRMTLTTEQQTDQYAATMEPANATKEEALFNNLTSTRTDKPGGFDNDGANAKVIRLNGDINTSGNKRVGPSIVLKVMAGDAISISTQAWYQGSTQAPPNNLPPLVNELASLLTNGILANGGDKSGTNSATAITDWVTPILNGFENNKTYDNSKPKAYLNWVIVDEEFKEVLSSNHKGAIQVNVAAGNMKQLLVGLNNLTVRRNGWLYVYLSNESNMNVYFDDLIVSHKRGPVAAAQDYYPFGMEIAGLSTKAIGFGGNENKYKYNGKDEQRKEFSDGSGLEWLDYGARMYDNQIGRWMTQDPHAYYYQNVTPYNYVMNNPMSYIDPNGMDYYFDYDGNYLGSDGNGDKLRLTQKSDYDAAQKAGKNAAKSQGLKGKDKTNAINASVHSALTTADKDGNSKSREITISGDEAAEAKAAGMSTVDYLYSQTNGDNKGERNIQIYLNTTTATIEFGPKVVIAPKDSDPNSNEYILTLPYASENYVLIGNIHGHPDSKVNRYDTQDPGGPGYSPADRGFARDRNITVYSIEKNGTGRGATNVYVNPPGGQTHTKYEGGKDARSIKQDAIWQRIRN